MQPESHLNAARTELLTLVEQLPSIPDFVINPVRRTLRGCGLLSDPRLTSNRSCPSENYSSRATCSRKLPLLMKLPPDDPTKRHGLMSLRSWSNRPFWPMLAMAGLQSIHQPATQLFLQRDAGVSGGPLPMASRSSGSCENHRLEC